MRCPDQAQLQSFLNETLTELDVSAVAAHVDRCDVCQATLDALSTGGVLPDDGSSDGSMAASLDTDEQNAVLALIDELRELPDDTQVSAHLASGSSSVADSSIELPGRLGNYELLKVVGEGATGRLYRALDLQLDRIVAVKTLKSELAAISSARARFEREARACAALSHDHIIAVHQVDPGEDGEPPYLVMEFIAGGSLQERIGGDKASTIRQFVEWIRQAATALQAAHDAGIVHRDVKPSNLLIDDATDRLRVADFGLARLVESEELLTAEGMIAGTPAYMSPEQIINPTQVTGLTDIYSLGVVLYEALSGELPFRGTMRMVLNQVLHEDPIPPGRLNDRIPLDLENVCLKAMSRERPLRYQTADAFADDLQRWLDDRPVLARPIGPLRKYWRWTRKNPRLAVGTAIVIAVLAAGAIDWRRFVGSAAATLRQTEHLKVVAEKQTLAADQQQVAMLAMADRLLYDVHNDLVANLQTLNARATLLTVTVEGLKSIPESSAHRDAAALAIMAAQNQLGRTYLQLALDGDATRCLQDTERLARDFMLAGTERIRSRAALVEALLSLSELDARVTATKTDDKGRTDVLIRAQGRCEEAVALSEEDLLGAAQSHVGASERSAWLQAARRHCTARQRLGDILERLDQANTAGTEYLAALAILSGMEATFGDDMFLQRDIGVLHLKLATLAVASQRDPLEYFRRAHSRFQTIHTKSPTEQARDDLIFTCENLVSSLLGHEDYREAARIAREECDLRAQLASESPHEDWFRRQYGECALRLGTIEGHLGQWNAAGEAINAAMQQFETLLQNDPQLLLDRVLQAEARLMQAARDLALETSGGTDRADKLEKLMTTLTSLTEQASDDELRQRLSRLQQQCRELQQSLEE
jgi:tRNA A-37 threonylcarbamoyl transferase component Bud32